jgi:peptide/nickel transport system substrate-binding protein
MKSQEAKHMINRTRRGLAFAAAALLLGTVIAGCGSKQTPTNGDTPPAASVPKKGGILKVAIIGEPPTLDMHTTTATLTFEVGWHIFETLYTYTADYGIQPMLAEKMPDITEGGKIYTIKLRQGVPFHDGKEMTSDDVVASINRWNKLAQNAKGAFSGLKSVTAKDKYTVEIAFDTPNATLLVALATPGNGLAIYTKEIAEKYPTKAIEEFIGTGPYKLVEKVADRYIKVQRFDKYANRTEESNGPGGKKYAYADEIRFIPVPDANTRLAGLESGEYDVAALLSGSQYETAKSNANLQAIVVKPISHLNVSFNMKQGPFTNKLVRQAALAVMDPEPIMSAAYGNKDLYRIDPSLMQKEQGVWWTDAGKENYNQHNVQKAKDLLKQSGYKGELIRFMATKEYDYNYKAALVYSEQMKAAGFNVELVVSDWATLVSNRAKPELWHMFGTGVSVKNSPLLLSSLGDKWFGWWVNPQRDELVKKIAGELDEAKAAKIFADLQKLYYDDVPSIKIGDYFTLRAARKNVKNIPTMGEYYFWNTYIDKK